MKLAAIRFMTANPLVLRGLAASSGDRIGAPLNDIVDELAGLLPGGGGSEVVMLRMAILGIDAAVPAAAQTDATDADIIAAARRAARALVGEVGGAR